MGGVDVGDLLEHLGGIRSLLFESFDVAREHTGIDLLTLLSPSGAPAGIAGHLGDGVNRNVAIFALSWSVGTLMIDAGLEPTALAGYSLGEIAAATVGGVWTLEAAVSFVADRAALFEEAGPGAMLGVHAPADDLRARFCGPDVGVAIAVTEYLTVLSGPVEAVAEVAGNLTACGYEHFAIRSDRAAHSSSLEPFVAAVERLAARQTLHKATLPIFNGETGELDDGSMQTPSYWGRHLRHTRRFASTLQTLRHLDQPLIVEVGPASLSTILARASDETPPVLQSLASPGRSNVAAMVDLFAALEGHGHRLSTAALTGRRTNHRIVDETPGTPLEHIGQVESEEQIASPDRTSVRRATTGGVLAILQSTLPSKLGEDEHFFEAGGNSLLAMEALARLQSEFQVRVKLREFLRNPTARALAAILRSVSVEVERNGGGADAPPSPKPQALPLHDTVATPGPDTRASEPTSPLSTIVHSGPTVGGPLLSVQFFNGDVEADSTDRYRLLLDSAQLADQAGLHALWFPERHFNQFGGLYPNAALLAAAVATMTTKIGRRGGSVVAPLHHPVRIAEEWAMVDNLSRGRAGISFGSGFVPRDFVLAPGAFETRKALMFESIKVIRSIWAGNPHAGVGGTGLPTSVQVFPPPVQSNIPLWLSTTRDIETFVEAGQLGVGVLTALLRLSTDELGERIAAYRLARKNAGHEGPGTVTLMLHTYIGADADDVQETASAPLRTYLRAHMEHTGELLRAKTLSSDDEEELLGHAAERYMSAGLFGTEVECRSRLDRLRSLGVDEVTCLMDFGLPHAAVLASVERLGRLSPTLPVLPSS